MILFMFHFHWCTCLQIGSMVWFFIREWEILWLCSRKRQSQMFNWVHLFKSFMSGVLCLLFHFFFFRFVFFFAPLLLLCCLLCLFVFIFVFVVVVAFFTSCGSSICHHQHSTGHVFIMHMLAFSFDFCPLPHSTTFIDCDSYRFWAHDFIHFSRIFSLLSSIVFFFCILFFLNLLVGGLESFRSFVAVCVRSFSLTLFSLHFYFLLLDVIFIVFFHQNQFFNK